MVLVPCCGRSPVGAEVVAEVVTPTWPYPYTRSRLPLPASAQAQNFPVTAGAPLGSYCGHNLAALPARRNCATRFEGAPLLHKTPLV